MTMKTENMHLYLIFLFSFSFSFSFGQNTVMFKKIIEPVEFAGVHNLRNKSILQKKFFPDNNGLIEFFEAPSFRAEYGFRVVQKDKNDYALEIKQIDNWSEIKNRIDAKYPLQIPQKTFPKEKRDEMNKVYTENVQKRKQEEKENLTILALK